MTFNKRSLITLGILAIIGVSIYYFFVTKGITYIWHWERVPEMLFYHGSNKEVNDIDLNEERGVPDEFHIGKGKPPCYGFF